MAELRVKSVGAGMWRWECSRCGRAQIHPDHADALRAGRAHKHTPAPEENDMPKPRKRRVKLPKVRTEPAVLRGVVVAVLTLLAGLGVTWAADVDKETVTAIVTVLGVLAPIVAAVWTRFAVTPNAKVVARVSTSKGAVVAGDAAVVPTGTPLPASPAVSNGIELAPVRVSRAVLAP